MPTLQQLPGVDRRGVPVGRVFIRSPFDSHLHSGSALRRQIFASGGCGIEELWHIVPYGPNALDTKLFTIQSHMTGGYLRGHESGKCDTVANCDEWERWRIEAHPADPGRFVIRSHHNTFLRCDDDALSVNLTKNVGGWEAWSIVGSTIGSRGHCVRRDGVPQLNQPIWLFGVDVVHGQVTNPTRSGLRAVQSLIVDGDDKWTMETFGGDHVAFKANDNKYLSGAYDRFTTGAAAHTLPPPSTSAELWKCVFLGPQHNHPLLEPSSSSAPPPIFANNVVFQSMGGKYVQCRDHDASKPYQHTGSPVLGVAVPDGDGLSSVATSGYESVLSESNRPRIVGNISTGRLGSSIHSSSGFVDTMGNVHQSSTTWNSTPLEFDTDINGNNGDVSPPATMARRQVSSDSSMSMPQQQYHQPTNPTTTQQQLPTTTGNTTTTTTTRGVSVPASMMGVAVSICTSSDSGPRRGLGSVTTTTHYHLDCTMGKVYCCTYDVDSDTPPCQWVLDIPPSGGSSSVSIGVFNSHSQTKRLLRAAENGTVSAPTIQDASSEWVVEPHPSFPSDRFTIRSRSTPTTFLTSTVEFGFNNPVVKAVSCEEQEPTLWKIFTTPLHN